MKLEHGQEDLDRRIENGEHLMVTAYTRAIAADEKETAGSDAVSDILTALFGPAGHYDGEKVVHDHDVNHQARVFLDHAYHSWCGDAEDYFIAKENAA